MADLQIVLPYVQVLLLIVIFIFTVLIYNNTKPVTSTFEGRRQFNFTPYTEDEIKQKWIDTKCTKPLTNELIKFLTTQPKNIAMNYINYYKKYPSTCNIPILVKNNVKYTPEQKAELKAIWTNSKCTAPYPENYVNTLEQKTNYTNGKKTFIQYVNDILRNNKYDDVEYMTLQKSQEACYGAQLRKK